MRSPLHRHFRRWLGAATLASAALYSVSSLPRTMAHEGKVSLELSGLQNVYEESDLVDGTVTVHSSADLENPRLQIRIYDPDLCDGAACRPVYNRTVRVRFKDDDGKGDDGKDGHGSDSDRISRPIQFRLDRPLTVSAYTVQATLTVGRDRDGDRNRGKDGGNDDRHRSTVAVNSARFGVRQHEMRGMPDTILKGDVTVVDVDAMRKMLSKGAASGEPVQLTFGSEAIKVRVEEREILAQGVTIPGLGRPTMYMGKVIKETDKVSSVSKQTGATDTETVEEDDDSFVTLTAAGDSINGIIARGRASGTPDENRSVMHIDAKKNYRGEEASDQHMVYDLRHTFPPPGLRPGDGENHHQGPLPPGGGPQARRLLDPLGRMAKYLGGLLMPPVLAQTSPVSRRFTVNVHVYEHDTGNVNWTANRWSMVTNALARLLEIQNVNPVRRDAYEIDPNQLVSVSGYVITGWSTIANQTGYSSDCSNNLGQFQRDIPNAELNTMHLFLTDLGNKLTSSKGCAEVVTPDTAKKRFAVVMDDTFYTWNYGSIVVAQEIGHGLDEHPNWSNCIPGPGCTVPHDSHTSPDISESWNSGISCTIMKAGYGACTSEYLEYQHSVGGTSALNHLASGVRTVFRADPVWTALPPLPNGDRATDIGVGGGQVWVIGGTNLDSAGNRHIYRLDTASHQWQQNGGNTGSTVRSAVRVAVDANGRPWVVTAAGAIFSKDTADATDLSYTLRPAPATGRGASDIAVGIGPGDVWIIGNDFNAAGNASIYNFQPGVNSWLQFTGAAKRISLETSSVIWVNTADGALYQVGSALVAQPGSGVRDIAGNGDGRILATAPLPGNTYRFVDGNWELLPKPGGGGVAIAADASGFPWLVDLFGRVWSAEPPPF